MLLSEHSPGTTEEIYENSQCQNSLFTYRDLNTWSSTHECRCTDLYLGSDPIGGEDDGKP